MQTGCLWGPGEKYHKWMDYVDFQGQQKRPGVKKTKTLQDNLNLTNSGREHKVVYHSVLKSKMTNVAAAHSVWI